MTEIPEELIKLLQPGTAVRIITTSGRTREIHHIRAVVDDEYIVYRKWSKRKQMWHYWVESVGFYHLVWQDGGLEKA